MRLETEKQLLNSGYQIVAGLDEVGRGPLAGPVVAGVVTINLTLLEKILTNLGSFQDIKDSKKLSAKKRLSLIDLITSSFLETGIGVCDNQTIDRINVREASFLAMKKALSNLKQKPDFLLLDGNALLPNSSYAQKFIPQGDAHIFSISAASILAKVARDKMMEKLDLDYPVYGFAKHKGYGTKFHLEQIKKHGPCQIHRRSFGPCQI